MCKFATGDIMDNLLDFHGIFFSSCGVVRSDRSLVMGKGFALQVKQAMPILPKALGQMAELSGELIEEPANRRYRGVYMFGLIPPYSYLNPDEGGWVRNDSCSAQFGAFQSKFHFANPSTVELIQYSVQCLKKWANKQFRMVSKKMEMLEFALNFPGIGEGGLTRSAIEPLLAVLPDNITVFSLDEKD